MIPTPENCSKEACADPDQWFARILRRWVALPLGRFDERYSNHAWLRVAVERFVCHIIETSNDSNWHGYWCDGVEFVEWKVDGNSYFFGGAGYISRPDAGPQWILPFELRIEYDSTNIDRPSSVDLRLGHRDPNNLFSERYPAGREHRLHAIAHYVYGDRPTLIGDWAIHVNLTPYPDSQSCSRS